MKRKKQQTKRFWFILSGVFFVFAIASVLYFAWPNNIDMEAVLSGQDISMGNEALILFSVFAFTLATVSVAKGYELIRRDKEGHKDRLHRAINDLNADNQRMQDMNQMLSQKNKQLGNEKKDLFFKVTQMQERVNSTDDQEKLLHKSILVLKRDVEKLLTQKEELMLDLSAKHLELQQYKSKKHLEVVAPLEFKKTRKKKGKLKIKKSKSKKTTKKRKVAKRRGKSKNAKV